MNVVASLNSNLFPIIHVGMYESHLSPENMFDDYQLDQDFEEGYSEYNAEQFWDGFKHSEYTEAIEKLASEYLDGQLESEDYGLTITVKCGSIYSPKYYNFATDQIDIEVEYDKELILNIARDNAGEFDKFLKENYSSYDGFLSHTANNYLDWKDDFKDDNVQSIGAVLTFLYKGNIETDNECMNWISFCHEGLYYGEFYNETDND